MRVRSRAKLCFYRRARRRRGIACAENVEAAKPTWRDHSVDIDQMHLRPPESPRTISLEMRPIMSSLHPKAFSFEQH